MWSAAGCVSKSTMASGELFDANDHWATCMPRSARPITVGRQIDGLGSGVLASKVRAPFLYLVLRQGLPGVLRPHPLCRPLPIERLIRSWVWRFTGACVFLKTRSRTKNLESLHTYDQFQPCACATSRIWATADGNVELPSPVSVVCGVLVFQR